MKERLNNVDKERQLLDSVRKTETLNGRHPVYLNAQISLREFDPNEVYPTAKYVLTGNLENIEAFGELMANEGHDILNLRERVDNGIGTISPPVVEMSDGVLVIIDGQHRFWMARQQGKKITAIFVEGAGVPTLSYPVTWDEVVQYDEKPETPSLLRDIREGIQAFSDDIRRYYRDLSHLGSLGRRPLATQTG